MKSFIFLLLFVSIAFGQFTVPVDSNWIKLDSLILTYFPLNYGNFYLEKWEWTPGTYHYKFWRTDLSPDSMYGKKCGNFNIEYCTKPIIYYSLEPGKLYKGAFKIDGQDTIFVDSGLYIDFTVSKGDSFKRYGIENYVVLSRDTTVTTRRLGTFQHCFVIYHPDSYYGDFPPEIYAPNVGKLAFVYAYVNGIEYGHWPSDFERPPDLPPLTSVEIIKEHPPTDFALFQNYPNPFNGSTVIDFNLPDPAEIKLTVFDVTGKEVKTILNSRLSAGSHSARWDGTDDSGQTVASGLYFIRLQVRRGESASGVTGQYSRTIKAIYTR